jgi:hypothetical protein
MTESRENAIALAGSASLLTRRVVLSALTLNQRVQGSSPYAPTVVFKDLAVRERVCSHERRHRGSAPSSVRRVKATAAPGSMWPIRSRANTMRRPERRDHHRGQMRRADGGRIARFGAGQPPANRGMTDKPSVTRVTAKAAEICKCLLGSPRPA